MDKEKFLRKRVSDPRDSLPAPPLNPQQNQQQQQKSSTSCILPEAFRRLVDYKDREAAFLKNLNETIAMDCKKIKSESEKLVPNLNSCETDEIPDKSDSELLRDECENYITPLLNRTGPSISAALVTYDAFEQLNRLHGLLDQMLIIQEQNYQMRRYLRDVRTLCELKKLQKKDPSDLLNEGEISDTELDLDNHVSLLSTILAAGNSASTKRSSAKRQRERSKSVIGEDVLVHALSEKEPKASPLRRQSAFSDSKGKVSKWTKVKAAFKWERANVPALTEGKSSDSGIGLTPINNEVARYLRVPSVPCTGSSADSVLSSSSGHLLSGGSGQATPGTISSASSIEDVGASEELRHDREASKLDTRCNLRATEDQTRRSRSLDGDAVVSPAGQQTKNKTPWKKVKDIIQTHRGSFKNKSRSRSIKSNESLGSRDASPCESIDTISNLEERNDGQISPNQKNMSSSPQDLESGSLPSSPSGPGSGSHRDEIDSKIPKGLSKGSRKSRMLSDFESLPEDVMVDLKANYNINKQPPSPLNLSARLDSSDPEFGDLSYSPTVFLKSQNRCLKPRKVYTPGNSSVPSSPSRHSEFFGEFESEDLSSGDFSEPTTPHRKLSPKTSLQCQQEEVNEKYLELREKLKEEFEVKRQEWDKIRAACSTSTSCAYQLLSKEDVVPVKAVPQKLLEENLSADFKKKLHKWRVKKQISVSNLKDPQISPTKESDAKKIDWNLWKTGQLKLDGQGLMPLPDQKDLPEDFQKKLEQWKKMKESNMVPPYNSQDSLKRQTGKSIQGSKVDGLKKLKDEDRSDREKQRPERDKLKSHEKDKLEKLSKLKAIVTDPRAKEIEVQTSAGVMKFEGISRKFTRKLYEWEKARGIGPESSTFALLHPGYRPLDVGNATQDTKSSENSPTLGRSLSLDSISPHPSVPSISHQPSSLSLNDMDELKETSESNDRRLSSDFDMIEKEQSDEPEAVIVEVEDDIIETAAPLLTAIPMVEQQTPVYKYEVPCHAMCSGTQENATPKTFKSNRLSSQALANVSSLKSFINDNKEDYKSNIKYIQSVLSSLKDSLPELELCSKGGNQQVLDTLNVIRKILFELMKMLQTFNPGEVCSKEDLSEKSIAINNQLRILEKSINVICKHIETTRQADQIPEINITSHDGVDKNVAIVSTTPTIFHSQIVVNQPKVFIGAPIPTPSTEIGDAPEMIEMDIPPADTSSLKKINRNLSNGSKKKARLRKMGSRQNSKTESDSSDEDTVNIVLEAPRRIKRKTSRAKKLPEDEKKLDEKKEDAFPGDDIVYVLKIKPGKVIEQHEKCPDSSVLISPTESCVQLLEATQENTSSIGNVFVKTKKKIFTTVEEQSGESKSVIVRDLESSSASERNDKEILDTEKLKAGVKNLPPIPQSPTSQGRLSHKVTPPKEPSPSIRLMIAKYNQKLASEKINRSPLNSGSCSPVMRSPVLSQRIKAQKSKYQAHMEFVVKSASAGNIRQDSGLISIDTGDHSYGEDIKILKSSSIETMPCYWKGSVNTPKDLPDYDYKPPLACDSLKLINKQSRHILKDGSSEEVPRKEHIYRKNREKPTSLFSKANTSKKIGTKSARIEFELRRSLSCSTSEANHSTPDKSDNTLPKITRKLEGKNASSSSSKPRSASIEPWFPSVSAPTTPLEETGRPRTPISERALKLQKAKEEFLRGHLIGATALKEETTSEDVWHKRLSQMSAGSESSVEDCVLLKSASVGVIESGSADNEHIGGYVSLPRTISRSEKLSNKFGFSTLASKFRKVRMRRGSKDQSKINAVSALCRQSLSIEVTPEEASLSQSDKNSCSSVTSLSKSGSTQALGFGSLFRKNDKSKLNKSKSSVII